MKYYCTNSVLLGIGMGSTISAERWKANVLQMKCLRCLVESQELIQNRMKRRLEELKKKGNCRVEWIREFIVYNIC